MPWYAAIAAMPISLVFSIIGLCLFAEAFFSGAELAMVSADKLRLHQRAVAGGRGAKIAEWLIGRPAWLFSTTLLGTNLAAITASVVTTFYIIHHYGPEYSAFALLISPVILIMGEILPKSICQHHANWIVDRVAPILAACSTVAYPLVWPLSRLTDRLLGGVRKASGGERRISREELVLMLDEGAPAADPAATDIRPIERTMISRILRLAEQRAKNVMVPLAEMECLPASASREAALAVFDLKGYSRLPVYEHRIYHVIGILDAIEVLCETKDEPLTALMRPPLFVPEEMPLPELFRLLQERGEKASIVVDEYGAAVGLVTIEDLFEEVVGEIRDEFALGRQMYQVLGPHHYLISGRLEVEIANERMGLGIPLGNYETVAGALLQVNGSIPRMGDVIMIDRYRYRIRQATDRAVLEVEVTAI
ncbi:MAG: HlyC/CorC family transporter [Deltaproteobacteria bacterium]|nr:HlyC/CorC family transporter [Deltaproteobacteria bacterium]